MSIFFGLFGAALLYGDGVITPAISVLSAVEGLEVATPALQPFVVPVTILILIALFSVQRRGTERIGAVFGPATLIWFITIAAAGLPWVIRRPEILGAISPVHALLFFEQNGWVGFLVLSAVVLCVTCVEALYADMGHFGTRTIRLAWFTVVFPALLINYFGQGALILDRGAEALGNPFYELVPPWLRFPLVIIATMATVIASQALISGAFSLTQQAIQLGYLPRTRIVHTSRHTRGQIYIPQVNWFLMFGCIGLVLLFGHSSRLAAAYGVAVTGTMAITSILFYQVIRWNWHWPKIPSLLLLMGFLLVDGAFLIANLTKLAHGGWISIVIALFLFVIMTSWKKGREAMSEAIRVSSMPIQEFFVKVARKKPVRVPGTAVFLTATEDIAPPPLLQHFKRNQVLHERVILLSIHTRNEPQVEASLRIRITELQRGFYKVQARYGYMEKPDFTEILIYCLGAGLELDIRELNVYLGRETVLVHGESDMPLWRKKLYVVLARNARPVTDYFAIPPDQVIEIGSQIAI